LPIPNFTPFEIAAKLREDLGTKRGVGWSRRERIGDNHYANSVVALRASTGKVVWHFQAVHHDRRGGWRRERTERRGGDSGRHGALVEASAKARQGGGLAVLLPPDAELERDPDEVLDLLDGLILAGGADIDAACGQLRLRNQAPTSAAASAI